MADNLTEGAMAGSGTGNDPFSAKLRAAENAPENDVLWDELEELVEQRQRPEELGETYRRVLAQELPRSVAMAVGERAAKFHEQWFSEDSPYLIEVLTRVLEVEPGADWALERATVLLTVGEKWGQLLALYDRALETALDSARRERLLEEAAQLAKDFAAEPDRAIDYLQRLHEARPTDGQLVSSLERLLERQSRWAELIELWRKRISRDGAGTAHELRTKIAACYLEHLSDAESTLREVETLLDAGVSGDSQLVLLEQIVGLEAAAGPVRGRALELLRDAYSRADRDDDILRNERVALTYASGPERAALHRALGKRLARRSEPAEAIEHFASVLELSPTDEEAQQQLAHLCEMASAHERYAHALVAAADAAEVGPRQFALLIEAGDVQAKTLGAREVAIDLYRRVLDANAHAAVKLTVSRRLERLLEDEGRLAERLAVLENLGEFEADPVERRRVLGECARLAEQLEEPEKALSFWQLRLDADDADREAIDAIVELSEKQQWWERNVDILRTRLNANPTPLQRRLDLSRIAHIQDAQLGETESAIETWTQRREEFGDDAETVDALFELFRKVGRYDELYEVLEQAIGRDASRAADVLARAGDVASEHLGKKEAAARAYHRAILMEPGLERAQSGLRDLVADPQSRSAAVRGLAKAYELTDNWQASLELLEHRLQFAADDAERVELLNGAVELYETRAEDSSAAFDALQRAFAIDPVQQELEEELLRLAAATGRWEDAAAAMGTAARELDERRSARAADLLRRAAKVREQELSDLTGSVRALLAALERVPQDDATVSEIVRVGVLAGDWDGAARATVMASKARGEIAQAPLDALQRHADEAGATDQLIAALAAAIPAPGAIDSALGRDLECRLADWTLARGDARGAEVALIRAVGHDDAHGPTLRQLAEVQSASPERPLVTTLLKLADRFEDDLDPLYDAATIAIERVADTELAHSILERLLRAARRLWETKRSSSGERQPPEMTVWALDELVRLELERGDNERAVDLLVRGSQLPVDSARTREMLRRAGEICREQGDEDRALRLLWASVEESVDDANAVKQLGELLEARGRLAELLALRQRQLALELSDEIRLEARLEVARVLGLLLAQGARVEVLTANLRETPGHPESIEALGNMLAAEGDHERLAALLSEQAERVQEAGDAGRAADLWLRAARLYQNDLENVEAALRSHRRVVQLDAVPESLEALADLHLARNEPGIAAEWLARRLDVAKGEERGEIALRLANAHTSAGNTPLATEVLERLLASDPAASTARKRLGELYREDEAYDALARLLTDGAPHERDPQRQLESVREAARLYETKLGQPDRAIPVLQMGIGLAPDDRELKTQLALGLRVAGRLDEAKEILTELLASFGRRRSTERASVHYQLAQVAHDAGELEAAVRELEEARKMDMSHPGILRMAAQLAHKAGELEKAEKAYRALLLVVRREDASSAFLKVGSSQVLYELSQLASAQDDVGQAQELLETAFSTAAQHDAEARRFAIDLVERGESELAIKVVERRLDAVDSDLSRARMLLLKSELLSKHLGRSDEGLTVAIEAVKLAPGEADLHDHVRKLAAHEESMPKYASVLEELVEGARRSEDARFGSDLLLRLALVNEQELGDLDAATELYRRVEQLGVCRVDAWLALARVADARGQSADEIAVLRKLVDESEAAVTNEARARALYRIAEVELGSGEWEKGLKSIRAALAREPRYARAGAILQSAVEQSPSDERLLFLYEEVARESGDAAMILDLLERRAAQSEGTLDHVREGVTRAESLGAFDRAEGLLRRGCEIAETFEGGLASAVWIPAELARIRQQAGDVLGAIEWAKTAAGLSEGPDAVQRWTQVAELAASEGGDLSLAAHTYRSLLASDPTNRELWQPLTEVYARLEDRQGLEEVVQSTLDALLDVSDRSQLRMFYAGFLVDVTGAPAEAVRVLESVLAEDPDHVGAAGSLADLFEAAGDRDQLIDLLHRQLDRARDRQDVEGIVILTQRLGALMGPNDPYATIDLYRSGLDWAPKSPELLSGRLALYSEHDDPRERADLMERLLAVSEGTAAVELANQLVLVRDSIGDDAGVGRALDLGFRADPDHADIRGRLENYYRDRQLFGELAEMIVFDARHRADDAEAVERYLEAAALYRDNLGAPGLAGATLRDAFRRKGALSLLEQLVHDFCAASMTADAAAEVTAALERHPATEPGHPYVLRLSGRIRLAEGRTSEAVQEFERAFAMDAAASSPDLIEGLQAHRRLMHAQADLEAERAATHRLADVLERASDREGSRQVLAEWTEREPTDTEALRILRGYDSEAGRWDDVLVHNGRLVDAEQGEEQVEAALGLVSASQQVERPEAARAGLESALRAQPEVKELRDALRHLYETTGADLELADMLLTDIDSTEDEGERFELLKRAGQLRVEAGAAEQALAPLSQASATQPDDHDLTITLADAYIGTGRLQEAVDLLQTAIGAFKRRRSPKLAAMQLRMARVAGMSGDGDTQKEWLSVALDADKNNGEVAAELAELAMQLGDDETALKALRVVTLQKNPGPMSKALAFLRQAQIAYRQGDQQKAVLWARRARLEDDELEEAHTFLSSIES